MEKQSAYQSKKASSDQSPSFPDHLVHRVSNLNRSSFVNSKVFPKERAGFVNVSLRRVTQAVAAERKTFFRISGSKTYTSKYQ